MDSVLLHLLAPQSSAGRARCSERFVPAPQQRGKRVIGYPSDLFQGGATGPTLMDSVLLHLLAPAVVRRTRSMFRAICSRPAATGQAGDRVSERSVPGWGHWPHPDGLRFASPIGPAVVRRTRSMFRAICSSRGGACNHKNSIKIMLLWRFSHHLHHSFLIKYFFSFNALYQLCWCVMCMAVHGCAPPFLRGDDGAKSGYVVKGGTVRGYWNTAKRIAVQNRNRSGTKVGQK